MVKYLKKLKMYSILNDIFGISPKMKDTDYKFYRGTEWLRFQHDGILFEICSMGAGNYLSVEKVLVNEDDSKTVLFRKVLNGFGRCCYPEVFNLTGDCNG